MVSEEKINIIIVSEKTPRSNSLSSIILEGCSYPVSVVTLSLSEGEEAFLGHNPDVCIVDLVSSENTLRSVFSNLKKISPGAAIIALHVYKTPELIKPLYDFGIAGYLYCEPARDELVLAIQKVANGDMYYPPFYLIAKNT